MRSLGLMLATAALAGCTTAPQQSRSAAGEARLQQLIAGKVAGERRSCLPSGRSSDMIVIDDDTVIWRDGASRVWRSELPRPCPRLASGHYTMIIRSFGGLGLCGGDIVELADTSSGLTAGSCVLGDFVPYTRPRA